MTQHITAATSIDRSGFVAALFATGPDTLIVDAGAFLIERDGEGADLQKAWTVIINGAVGGYGGGHGGLDLTSADPADFSTVKIGSTGDVFGGFSGLFFFEASSTINKGSISGGNTGLAKNGDGAFSLNNSGSIQGGAEGLSIFGTGIATIINRGTISGATSISAGTETHITNFGALVGDVVLFDNNDTFTEFKKVGNVIKNGTVVGVIDLGKGTNHFTGGSHAEMVKDGGGTDTVKLGGGNDTYIAVFTTGTPGNGTLDGGKGVDTYDASGTTNSVGINLDSVPHGFLLGAHSALGIDIGGDQLTGFENAVGGSNDDSIYGSSGANRLDGGDGTDNLFGFNGRDTLTGGGDDDIFHFTQLSDSGLKSSTRDVITDFSQGEGDKIHLSAIDANGSAAGEGIFNFIGTDPFSHARGELRESYSNGNTIVSGDVNGDGKADFSIALTGHITLLAGDFNL